MFTVLILVVFAAGALTLILLAVVVVAIRQEPRDTEMSKVAPSADRRQWSGACSGSTYADRLPRQTALTGKRNGRRTCHRPLHEAVRQAGGGEKPLQAYTVEQVAKMLHIGRDKVYYLLRTGQLRSLKIGKLRRITEQQLAEFIASLDKAI